MNRLFHSLHNNASQLPGRGVSETGVSKLQDWTLHDWTQTDEVARVDIAALDNGGRGCKSEL